MTRADAWGRMVRGTGWFAACAGVVAVYLASSVVAYLLVGSLCSLLGEATAPALGMEAGGATNMYLTLAMQLVSLVVFGLWWRWLRPRSFLASRMVPLDHTHAATARRVGGIVLLGVGLQVLISFMLSLVAIFFPASIEEYAGVMEESGTNVFNVLSVVVVALGASLTEELTCRGVMLEFALRAVCPEWRARWRRPERRPKPPVAVGVTQEDFSVSPSTDGGLSCGGLPTPVGPAGAAGSAEAVVPAAAKPADAGQVAEVITPKPADAPVPWKRFAVAAAVQALAFAWLHGNIVQGAYAFVIGLIFATVAWRTGRLRYNMLLHLSINLSSYALSALLDVLSWGGTFGVVIVPAAACAVGAWLFWRGSEPSACA